MSAGRPKVPDEDRLVEGVRVTFTAATMREMLIAAAEAGHKNVREWIRSLVEQQLRSRPDKG